jgi:iron uptake system component EfeO
MITSHRRLATTLLPMAAALALAGCTDNPPGPTASSGTQAGSLSVVATDDACQVSSTQAPSGTLTFAVTNQGAEVTEFYLLAGDGRQIVGEVENIGPGLTRDLVLQAAPGTYYTACKPGMTGDGIQAEFTVTDSGADLTPDR